jgi:hypothetical protein
VLPEQRLRDERDEARVGRRHVEVDELQADLPGELGEELLLADPVVLDQDPAHRLPRLAGLRHGVDDLLLCEEALAEQQVDECVAGVTHEALTTAPTAGACCRT